MNRKTGHNRTTTGASILVIAAHADDAELGTLGFLLQSAQAGARLTICVLADGSLGGVATVRQGEAAAVTELIGAELIWGGLPDTRVRLRPAIDIVEKAIAVGQPSLVLVHDPADTHQDHRVAARATLSAARNVPELYFYEGPSSRRFDPVGYVNISSVMDRKLSLLDLHASQLQRRRFDEWARVTALYRGLSARPSCQYAEAFRPYRLSVPVAGLATCFFPAGALPKRRRSLSHPRHNGTAASSAR